MTRILLILAAATLVAAAGCGADSGPSGGAAPTVSSAPTPSPVGPPPGATPTPGGCGTTQILFGAYPDWLAEAGLPSGMRYAISHEGNLVGVFFANPLVAPPHPAPGPNNKILWISRVPRDGNPLNLSLRAAGGGDPVTVTQPANSSPGEIYPSIVDVPKAGCWTVEAAWGANRATLELTYIPPGSAPTG